MDEGGGMVGEKNEGVGIIVACTVVTGGSSSFSSTSVASLSESISISPTTVISVLLVGSDVAVC